MMEVKRYRIDNSSIFERINEFISDSFFSSKPFMECWEKENGKGVVWTVEENNTVLAILCGIEFGVKPFCRFQSMPDGCFGGVIINSNIKYDISLVKRQLLDKIMSFGYMKVFIYDYFDSIQPIDAYKTFEIQTQILYLSDESIIPQDRKLKGEIKKAQIEDVSIERFEKEKHFDKFLKLMKMTEDRHQRKAKYSASFFEKLAKVSKENNKIFWLWCEHDSKAVASHINIIDRNVCLNWLAYYNKEFSYLKSNQLMESHLIEILRNRNINKLNMGASPENAVGLVKYKSKWGAKKKTYKCIFRKSWLGKLF